jgi:hypothetical protein
MSRATKARASKRSSTPKRSTPKVPTPRAPAPQQDRSPCCPSASDLVILEMGNPVLEDDANFRGFRRVHSDGSYQASEHLEPYGYVIPKGKWLMVTDIAYSSGFTKPRAAGTLTELRFGLMTVTGQSVGQRPIFETTSQLSSNGWIGGNVAMRTGFAIANGHYLSVNLFDHELVATYIFVYGYLIPGA